ncbi:acyltransferase family protein [Nonomuraea sp. NPDC002799]
MRFAAAFLVFLSHAFVVEALLGDPALTMAIYFPGLALGFAGVGFFFVLSGFVLAWSAVESDSPRSFLRRRFVKIAPNHLVAWAAAVLLAAWAGEQAGLWTNVASFFLVHAWVPGMTAINGPTWSLSVEVVFYLALPWLLPVVRRIRPQRLWWYAGVVVAAIVAVPFLAQLILPSEPSFQGAPMSLVQNWFVYMLPLTRGLDFTLGLLMARIVRHGLMVRVPLSAALLVLAAGFTSQVLLMPTIHSLVAPVVVPLTLVVAAAADADLRGTSSLFRHRAMIWLGEISYAFFVVHYLVLHFGHRLIGVGTKWDTATGLALIGGSLIVTTGIAWLLHVSVERPCMRRWSRPRRKSVPLDRPSAATA